MRNLNPPDINVTTIFNDCVSSIGNSIQRGKFEKIGDEFINAEVNYLNAANERVLYKLPWLNVDDNKFICDEFTKKDINKLYSDYMVPASKKARQYYDKLIIGLPHRKCPFCGFGRATTLDHFLNKSDYPWLSIVPANLVPACMECNHGKGARRARSENDQTIHPYFECSDLSKDQWLFASVRENMPLTLDYRAEPPEEWDQAFRQRVIQHFIKFNLKERFAIEAAPELASLRFTLKKLFDMAGRRGVADHLACVAAGEKELFRNSWKTALYQALTISEWYINGGYLME